MSPRFRVIEGDGGGLKDTQSPRPGDDARQEELAATVETMSYDELKEVAMNVIGMLSPSAADRSYPGGVTLSPLKFPRDLCFQLMGITRDQARLAFSGIYETEKPLLDAMERTSRAIRSLEAALETERREILLPMLTKYPAAARRIMAGKPPRRRKRRASTIGAA